MGTENLPAKENTLFRMLQDPALKKQIQVAIPKHMTVDRLLRVAMTAIRTTPKLMECTPKSLMACIMGCAQLGLEPEPFLGQAYFVPFNVNVAPKGQPARWEHQATLIPGYRGYIALARRSGEVQSVTAQAVYSNDQFRMQFGLQEELYHIPADQARGDFRGAYVIFRYKDGSHSFDWMPKDRIDKVRERSKAKDSGPWVTDYDEMAVKTVIRHHVKLVPLSVELAKAAHLEERAMIGEDQAGLIFGETESGPELIESTNSKDDQKETAQEEPIEAKFYRLAGESGIRDRGNLDAFLKASAEAMKKTEPEMMVAACSDFPSFRKIFERSMAKKQQKEREREEIEAKTKAAESKKAKANATEKAGPKGTELRMEQPPDPGPFPEEAEKVDKKTGEVFPGPFSTEVQDNRPDGTFIVCTARQGDKMSLGFCRTNCPSLFDCEDCKPK